MAELFDTVSKVINGKDGTADFTIDDGVDVIHYKCILDMIAVREVTELTSADTFCTEGSADQEPGRSQLLFNIRGLLKKGGPAAGPLIPSPQNVAIVATMSTGCTIEFTANFEDSSAVRIVNQNGRIEASGRSKGLYTVTWDLTSEL